VEATQVLLHRCDLPSLRFDPKVHGSYSVNQKQQVSLPPMSGREDSRQSHISQNVPEEARRDDRHPSAPLARYAEQPMPPSASHSRSDSLQYAPYTGPPPPPPPPRLSYPPGPPHRPDTRHAPQAQQQLDLARSHERAIVYPRHGGYYPQEAGVAPVHQPAPRQRTAVACRYCRRRKVLLLLIQSSF
jgi:hypothetical protein